MQRDGKPDTAEHRRLAEATGRAEDDLFNANPWYEWGPYLSERAWGTVREDYSENGDAWRSFPHDHARSRSYRWNEDGMAGLSDIRHELCLGLSLWNGVDPILKERMFGLTGPEGNHGEDVKEYWWFVDGLPSHAWLRWRYHYPQAAYPYQQLIDENARRSREEPEYELLDTGVFADDRFWAVEVTYAKVSPTEVLVSITVENRGPDEATIDVLPTLWFRNRWRWYANQPVPVLKLEGDAVVVEQHRLEGYRLEAATGPDGVPPRAVFCDNETNTARLYGAPPLTAYPKDGINDHVVSGADTVNPEHRGTKAAWWYHLTVPAGGTSEIRLRLHLPADDQRAPAWSGADFDAIVAERRHEADEFYAAIAPAGIDDERMRVLRQASAGLVWSKQTYAYDVGRWLDGDATQPPPPEGRHRGRNADWRHVDAFDVLAMPDPWEYPWFAAWDLAFHAVPWAHLDPAFAKYQLGVLLREWFLHPNGALPAYEWSFDDVNPPVHALAAIRVFVIDGSTDTAFLERVFQKLLLNFTWWVNRQDPDGNNLFGGGFLGLDNICPVDRSSLPSEYRIEQADGTAWMAYYALAMLELARELAAHNPVYDAMVVKFLEHFVQISEALDASGMLDADDAFFYDRLIDAHGNATPIRVQSLVGVLPGLPAASITITDAERSLTLNKHFARRLEAIILGEGREWRLMGEGDSRRLLVSMVSLEQMRKGITTLFDEDAFLSPYGLRSLSKRHRETYQVPGIAGASIEYAPAEARTGMFGGNSNWRGPVWLPTNYLVIQALVQYDRFFGPERLIEYPTGSGREMSLGAVAADLADRLVSIWLPDGDGRRPVNGRRDVLDLDPAWRDQIQFFEYFHGDLGIGLGASHQTGWTALVVDLIIDRPGVRAGSSP